MILFAVVRELLNLFTRLILFYEVFVP